MVMEQLDTNMQKKKNKVGGTSLVVRGLRIHLPMQGTRVQAVIWEDTTCQLPLSPCSRFHVSQLLKPGHPRTGDLQQEKAPQ